MQLTPEQLEQCRKDFDKKFDASELWIQNENCYFGWMGVRFEGFQSAWRPIPSVEEIAEVLKTYRKSINGMLWIDSPHHLVVEAIHRAFGGEE